MEFTSIIILILIIAVVALASMYSSASSSLKYAAEKKKELAKQLLEHKEYLKKKCGYEIPKVSSLPMAEEIETLRYQEEFADYEKEYKNIGLSATAEIGDTLYDIRECRFNEQAIKLHELEYQTIRYKLAVYYFNKLLEEYQRTEKGAEQSFKMWEKVAKKTGVNDVVTLVDLYRGLESFGDGNITNVDEAIKKAKKRKQTISKERINELKKRARKEKLELKLINEYKTYLKLYEESDDPTIRNGRKFQALRKKFDDYSEE